MNHFGIWRPFWFNWFPVFFCWKALRAREGCFGNPSRVLHQVDLRSKPPSPDPPEETQHFHAHSIRLQPKIHFPKHSFRSMNMHRNIATQTIGYCMGKFQEVRWIVKIDSKNSLRCRHTSQHSHTRHMQRRSDQCIASRRASRLHATWSSDESTTLANSMLSLWTLFAIRCDAPLWGCHWTSKSDVWHNETVDWIDSIGKSHWYICHGDMRGDRKSRNKRRPNDDLCFSLRKISQFDLTEINHMVDWRFYFEWLPFALRWRRWICHCFRDLVFFSSWRWMRGLIWMEQERGPRVLSTLSSQDHSLRVHNNLKSEKPFEMPPFVAKKLQRNSIGLLEPPNHPRIRFIFEFAIHIKPFLLCITPISIMMFEESTEKWLPKIDALR